MENEGLSCSKNCTNFRFFMNLTMLIIIIWQNCELGNNTDHFNIVTEITQRCFWCG